MNDRSEQTSGALHVALPAGLDLREKLAVIRRSWWIVMLVTVVALGSAWYLTARQERVYGSSAVVLLRTDYNDSLFAFAGTGQSLLERYPDSEKNFVDESSFRLAATDATPSGVSVSVREDYDAGALVFSSRGTVPADVAAGANAWADTYLVQRQADLLNENQASIDFLDATLLDLTDERAGIRSDVVLLERRLELATDDATFSRLLNQKNLLEDQLQPELEPIEAQISELNSQVAELKLLRRVLDGDGISARVSSPASVPSTPISPNVPRNLATAGLLGLALGSGLAYGRHALATSVVNDSETARAAGLEVLATIPKFSADKNNPIEVLAHPGGRASEQYKSLMTALEFSARAEPLASILISSPHARDGKSTTAVNLAVLASSHISVLLVGADLRRPSLHHFVGAENDLGLSTLLQNEAEFEDVRIHIDHPGGRFDLLTSGPAVADPTWLLRSEIWRTLLEKLVSVYDLVIIDGPPVLPVTDALLLGRDCTAQLVVARSGTSQQDLSSAVKKLRTSERPILGLVVNQDRGSSNREHDYYYGGS